AAAAVTNPELFIDPLKDLVNDPEVDNIIFTEFPMEWDADSSYLQEFIQICKNSDKFIFITTFPLEGMAIPRGTEELEKNGIPVITGHLNPIRSLAKLVAYGEKYRKTVTKSPTQTSEEWKKKDISHLLSPGVTLSESQASIVLENYDIKTAKKAVANLEAEAVQSAKEIGYPVVLKIDSSDIPHKTEANAVKLNVNSEVEVAA